MNAGQLVSVGAYWPLQETDLRVTKGVISNVNTSAVSIKEELLVHVNKKRDGL